MTGAVCDSGYYFKRGYCVDCAAGALSRRSKIVLAVVGGIASCMLVANLLVRRCGPRLKRLLRLQRRRLRGKRYRRRRRDAPAPGLTLVLVTLLEGVARHAIRNTYAFVKHSMGGIGLGESVRIFLNAAKVCNGLYSSLSFCLVFPATFGALRDLASVFAVDVLTESRLPCLFAGFSFYTRVIVAAAAPFVVSSCLALCGAAWVGGHYHVRRKRPSVLGLRRSVIGAVMGEMVSIFEKGLWTTAKWILNAIDLIYPVICQSLLRFFACKSRFC